MARPPDLAMRSLDARWDRARWEGLPDDGNGSYCGPDDELVPPTLPVPAPVAGFFADAPSTLP